MRKKHGLLLMAWAFLSNPVRRGLVENPEGWKWSSLPEFSGVSGEDQERTCGLPIDRVPLPFDIHTRI